MLTQKQHALLLFIHEQLQKTGVSPSFEEMKEALDLKSKSGVHRLISALEERRFLRRLPNRARALEILRLPEDTREEPVSARISNISEARERAVRAEARARQDDTCVVPLVGRIAAGMPIEAVENHSELAVPAALLGPGEHYALQVSGDSMVEAGILDGDLVLIRSCEDARDGEIVVALIDNQEATLKYLRREKNMIRLDPANHTHQPQRYPASLVKIQGKLAGLYRSY